MKYYLAGPMSGYPQFNIPAFDRIGRYLRNAGFEIVSPAELDHPVERLRFLASPNGAPGATGRTWGDFLSRDVRIVANEVQGVFLMDGWAQSRGAKLEAFVGYLCGHDFKRVTESSHGITWYTVAAGEVKENL